jgi:Flp pilus assembly protein TadG
MALPILFLLVFGLFDLGQWEFMGSQASAAARDGARAGLMAYKTAEGTTASPGGAGFTTINNAVAARLDRQSYTLTVACVSSVDEIAKPCSSAQPDVDRIKVSVAWTRSPLTPVTASFGTQQVSGNAVMKVIGVPE